MKQTKLFVSFKCYTKEPKSTESIETSEEKQKNTRKTNRKPIKLVTVPKSSVIELFLLTLESCYINYIGYAYSISEHEGTYYVSCIILCDGYCTVPASLPTMMSDSAGLYNCKPCIMMEQNTKNCIKSLLRNNNEEVFVDNNVDKWEKIIGEVWVNNDKNPKISVHEVSQTYINGSKDIKDQKTALSFNELESCVSGIIGLNLDKY